MDGGVVFGVVLLCFLGFGHLVVLLAFAWASLSHHTNCSFHTAVLAAVLFLVSSVHIWPAVCVLLQVNQSYTDQVVKVILPIYCVLWVLWWVSMVVLSHTYRVGGWPRLSQGAIPTVVCASALPTVLLLMAAYLPMYATQTSTASQTLFLAWLLLQLIGSIVCVRVCHTAAKGCNQPLATLWSGSWILGLVGLICLVVCAPFVAFALSWGRGDGAYSLVLFVVQYSLGTPSIIFHARLVAIFWPGWGLEVSSQSDILLDDSCPDHDIFSK